jgi:hypothetical protein
MRVARAHYWLGDNLIFLMTNYDETNEHLQGLGNIEVVGIEKWSSPRGARRLLHLARAREQGSLRSGRGPHRRHPLFGAPPEAMEAMPLIAAIDF